MTGKYQIHCQAAAYDEENAMIVLVCFFKEMGETRLVYFPRSDFHFKSPGMEVPHREMHKTAEMFKNAHFSLIIESDPNRNREAEENPATLTKEFVEYVEEQLQEVTRGLSDSDRVMTRRLGEVIERDHKRRFSDLLADEMSLRARLDGIDFG